MKKRFRRLKEKARKWILFMIAIAVIIASWFVLRNLFTEKEKNLPGITRVDSFKDPNRDHLKHARRKGIKPFTSGKGFHGNIRKLEDKGALVKVNDSRYYIVDNLTHSHPYLVPEALELLYQMGALWHRKLEENGLRPYRFRITSLLRTVESQKNLGRTNRNAATSSAHLYGTTFDISYKSLVKKSFMGRNKQVTDQEAIRLLSETIRELRKRKKLIVITEYREACFHITLRN